MSRNLGRTNCRQCDGPVGVTGVQYRYETPGPAQGMWVADADCQACGARYTAWIGPTPDGPYGSRQTDQFLLAAHGFYDLSYRSTFNDEPGPDDVPAAPPPKARWGSLCPERLLETEDRRLAWVQTIIDAALLEKDHTVRAATIFCARTLMSTAKPIIPGPEHLRGISWDRPTKDDAETLFLLHRRCLLVLRWREMLAKVEALEKVMS